MSYSIRRVDYFYATVRDQPGEAYKVLQDLDELGINMYAFAAVPIGPDSTQVTLFPENASGLQNLAKKSGLQLIGPYHAFLVQGRDELGALVDVHQRLFQAGVNVYASHGVTSDAHSYGYIIYVRPNDFERAAHTLEV